MRAIDGKKFGPMKRVHVANVMVGALLVAGCYAGAGDSSSRDSGGILSHGGDDDDDDAQAKDSDDDGVNDEGHGTDDAGGGANGDGGLPGDAGANEDGGVTGTTVGIPSDDGGDTSDVDVAPAELCTEVSGPRIVRRLTSKQLHRTLQDIFGDANVPQGQVVDDPIVRGFKVDAHEAVIRDIGAQQVMQYAERVAEWAVTEKLSVIAPCQSLDASCRDQIVRTLGAKFHREPLTEDMVATYGMLMDGESEFPVALRQLVAALIQSPYFLYRREIGADDAGVHRLTDYELASSLSYSLTAGPPDEELLTHALAGQLHDEAVLVAQAYRLTQTPAGQEVLADFVHGWLEVDDLQSRVKVENNGVSFDEDMRALMLNETAMLFQSVFNSGGAVAQLFTADYTFVSQRLAHFYRMWQANSPTPESFPIPAEGEGYRGTGLLAHGSVLARHASADNSSPVLRGVMVRRRLLCATLPDPPSDVDTNLTPIPAGSTNRQRYEQHRLDPDCAGCHNLIDPVGFTFEHYDEFGRWRDQESGQPVDASGELTGLSGTNVPLNGLDSLSAALAESAEVRSCFSRFVAYYVYGSGVCDTESARRLDAVPPGASLRAVLEGVVKAPYFRERIAVD